MPANMPVEALHHLCHSILLHMAVGWTDIPPNLLTDIYMYMYFIQSKLLLWLSYMDIIIQILHILIFY